MTQSYFTPEEHISYLDLTRRLLRAISPSLHKGDYQKVRRLLVEGVELGYYNRDSNGINGLLRNMGTAVIMAEEMKLERDAIITLLLYRVAYKGMVTTDELAELFGNEVRPLFLGLLSTSLLYTKKRQTATLHFDKLMLALAEDLRVILMMIADRLYMLRQAPQLTNEAERIRIASEAIYLHIPLAHQMGLYLIKSEMEDLYLKTVDRATYSKIARQLQEKKTAREEYIHRFIIPINEKLQAAGLRYEVKLRTKSIYSIYNKIKKQNIDFEYIFDLLAIRIILDAPEEQEKQQCWQVYSIVADLYQPNPKRMRDWLSVPKSNGYESLHTTVLGDDGKWVEVQIRTQRMDEIAEKGVAAHWKYKGVSGEDRIAQALRQAKEALADHSNNQKEVMEEFKMDLYDDEIFVFTPKGDLFRLPSKATVLDFAFAIHSNVGARCISAKLEGRNVSIRHRLKSGDSVEIITSPHQAPTADWLNVVVTAKARSKIKQTLKEAEAKEAGYGKELLLRRLKNRKIELEESLLMRQSKREGYKSLTEFYAAIARESLNVAEFIDHYLELEQQLATPEPLTTESATAFVATPKEETNNSDDVLLIDQNLKGIDYQLARCCNPIFGDEIFGYVSTHGIRIHRINCPNATDIFKRFGYRIVPARWTGNSKSGYEVVLRIVGRDDLGIVSSLSSMIEKADKVRLRGIEIDSTTGLFSANLNVILNDTGILNQLIKKLATIKGVNTVERIS